MPLAVTPAPVSASLPSRIVILSVSAGAGHTRAAEALCAYAGMHPERAHAIHLDVMDYVPSTFKRIYTDFYLALVKRHPAVWRQLYQMTHDAPPDSRLQSLRGAVERFNARTLRQELAALAPDLVICTHFLPAALLARMLGRGQIAYPVWVQVTDFDLHRMWVQQGMQGYFAASEEVAYRLRASGIRADRIHVTGIPIMPAFAHTPDRRACAQALGLDPARPIVLLMVGDSKPERLEQAIPQLLRVDARMQLIVVAGRNAAALQVLQALAGRYPGRLVAQGFTRQIERLMACADFAITKSGGLTCSECLALGVPMIVTDPIPGQEERNADFLLEQGVALKACDLVTLEYRVQSLLRQPGKLAQMRARAKALGQPGAARQVLDIALGAQANA